MPSFDERNGCMALVVVVRDHLSLVRLAVMKRGVGMLDDELRKALHCLWV